MVRCSAECLQWIWVSEWVGFNMSHQHNTHGSFWRRVFPVNHFRWYWHLTGNGIWVSTHPSHPCYASNRRFTRLPDRQRQTRALKLKKVGRGGLWSMTAWCLGRSLLDRPLLIRSNSRCKWTSSTSCRSHVPGSECTIMLPKALLVLRDSTWAPVARRQEADDS